MLFHAPQVHDGTCLHTEWKAAARLLGAAGGGRETGLRWFWLLGLKFWHGWVRFYRFLTQNIDVEMFWMILTGEAGWKVFASSSGFTWPLYLMRFQKIHEATLGFWGYTLVQNGPDWEKKTSMRPPWLEVIFCCFCLRAGGCDDHGFASTFCFCRPVGKYYNLRWMQCYHLAHPRRREASKQAKLSCTWDSQMYLRHSQIISDSWWKDTHAMREEDKRRRVWASPQHQYSQPRRWLLWLWGLETFTMIWTFWNWAQRYIILKEHGGTHKTWQSEVGPRAGRISSETHVIIVVWRWTVVSNVPLLYGDGDWAAAVWDPSVKLSGCSRRLFGQSSLNWTCVII